MVQSLRPEDEPSNYESQRHRLSSELQGLPMLQLQVCSFRHGLSFIQRIRDRGSAPKHNSLLMLLSRYVNGNQWLGTKGQTSCRMRSVGKTERTSSSYSADIQQKSRNHVWQLELRHQICESVWLYERSRENMKTVIIMKHGNV
jgi:hypothetical protein